MMPFRFRLAELTGAEARARLAARPTLLLPLGSLEDHGPHAPMGDHLLVEAIALRIAERAAARDADTLVVPVLPFGGADFFGPTPGGIALSPATLRAVLADMIARLSAHGLDRLLVVNGHGGNRAVIEEVVRDVRESRGVIVPTVHVWAVLAAAWPRLAGEGATARLGHGADPVWSVALALRPDLCRPEAIPAPAAPATVAGLPVSGFGTAWFGDLEVALPVAIDEIAPSGVAAGAPRLGDAATGERAVTWLAEEVAQLIVHLRSKH
ncbi:creatininase family protein [Elioraea thermophila]|uniref:creatininase family protein n=1 Tax=Elioraea thermophila TaxID=2185104 RepID=UPI000DF468FB|nr:creatininase family protein [Elioraea thermophila]